MNRTLLAFCTITALMTGPAVFAAGAPSDLIEHHGYRVNPEGNVRDCLSCHDGAMVETVSYCTVKCDFSTAHSVLKRYPPRRNRKAYASLKAVRALGVRIVGGRVVCISCHDLRKPDRLHLILDNQEALCRICHLLPKFTPQKGPGNSAGADIRATQ